MHKKRPLSEGDKQALVLSCFVCALSSFGAFFRWLQNMLAFEKDSVSYLMNPSAWPVVIIAYTLLTAFIFIKLIRKLTDRKLEFTTDVRMVFHSERLIIPIAAWAIGGLMMLGGIITLIQIEPTDNTGLLTLIGLLAILSGFSLPMIAISSKRRFSPGLVFVFMLIPVFMFCAWLLYSYELYSTIPETWVYAVEIVAICVAIFAFLFNAGYPAGRVKPKKALFFSMLASFFCFMTLADERSTGLTLLMLSSALMLLLENWLVISNMTDPEKKNAEPPKSAPKQRRQERIEDEVIPKGGDTENEPTIELFDFDVKEWKGSSK